MTDNMEAELKENGKNQKELDLEWLDESYYEALKDLSENLCEALGSAMADASLSHIIYQIEENIPGLIIKDDGKKITTTERNTMLKRRNRWFNELETKIWEIKNVLDEMLMIIATRRWNTQSVKRTKEETEQLIKETLEGYKNDPKRITIAILSYGTKEEIIEKFKITDEDTLVDTLVQCYLEGSKPAEWERFPFWVDADMRGIGSDSFREFLLGDVARKLGYGMDTVEKVYEKLNEKPQH